MHMFVQFCLAGLLRLFLPRHFRPDNSPEGPDYVYVHPALNCG